MPLDVWIADLIHVNMVTPLLPAFTEQASAGNAPFPGHVVSKRRHLPTKFVNLLHVFDNAYHNDYWLCRYSWNSDAAIVLEREDSPSEYPLKSHPLFVKHSHPIVIDVDFLNDRDQGLFARVR